MNSSNPKPWLKILLLLPLVFLLSSCVNLKVKITLLPNGGVEQQLDMAYASSLAGLIGQEQVDKSLNDTLQKLQVDGWEAQVNGLEIHAKRLTKGAGWAAGTLDVGMAQLVQSQNNKPIRITHGGFFFVDNIRLDMDFGNIGGNIDAFTKSLMNDVKLEVAVETPWEAKTQNASSINQKEYTWRLGLSDPNQFYVEYQIIRWDRILPALAGAGLIAFLLIRRSRNAQNILNSSPVPVFIPAYQTQPAGQQPVNLIPTALEISTPPSPSGDQTPTVRVQLAPQKPTGFALRASDGKRFELPIAPAIASVGRSDADVLIPDSSVSIVHARIVVRENTLDVIDMGSTNGTLVNGRSITARQATKVSSGDTVQFGLVKLEVLQNS